MQSSDPEHLSGELQLLPPVLDDFSSKKIQGPLVHLLRHLLCGFQKDGVLVDGQFQVSLIVEGHVSDLPQGVLPVEHPAIGA